jgi:hypothetical protein
MSVPPRTTVEAVQGILQSDYDWIVEPDLTGYIETASNIIDQCLYGACEKRVPLSDTTLELMERWLAAHCYVQFDQTYTERRTLRAQGRFQGQTGMNLESSKYGQTAIMLDPSGTLKNINDQNRVRMWWTGKPRCAAVSWWSRNGRYGTCCGRRCGPGGPVTGTTTPYPPNPYSC